MVEMGSHMVKAPVVVRWVNLEETYLAYSLLNDKRGIAIVRFIKNQHIYGQRLVGLALRVADDNIQISSQCFDSLQFRDELREFHDLRSFTVG